MDTSDGSEPASKRTKSLADMMKSTDPDEVMRAMMASYETPENSRSGNARGGALGTGSLPPSQTKDCPTPMSNASKQLERESQMVSDTFQRHLAELNTRTGTGTVTPQQVSLLNHQSSASPVMSGLPPQSSGTPTPDEMAELVAKTLKRFYQ